MDSKNKSRDGFLKHPLLVAVLAPVILALLGSIVYATVIIIRDIPKIQIDVGTNSSKITSIKEQISTFRTALLFHIKGTPIDDDLLNRLYSYGKKKSEFFVQIEIGKQDAKVNIADLPSEYYQKF